MLSCFIDNILFSIEELTASVGVYTFGSYTSDRRIVMALSYNTTSGNVTINTFKMAGHSPDTTYATADGKNAGCRIGIFNITESSGSPTISSTLSNGATIALKVYKILGYNGDYAENSNQGSTASITISTINGRAAIEVTAEAGGAGDVSLTNPTSGSSVTAGPISGIDASAMALSFA